MRYEKRNGEDDHESERANLYETPQKINGAPCALELAILFSEFFSNLRGLRGRRLVRRPRDQRLFFASRGPALHLLCLRFFIHSFCLGVCLCDAGQGLADAPDLEKDPLPCPFQRELGGKKENKQKKQDVQRKDDVGIRINESPATAVTGLLLLLLKWRDMSSASLPERIERVPVRLAPSSRTLISLFHPTLSSDFFYSLCARLRADTCGGRVSVGRRPCGRGDDSVDEHDDVGLGGASSSFGGGGGVSSGVDGIDDLVLGGAFVVRGETLIRAVAVRWF